MKNTFRTRLLPLDAGLTLLTGALAGCGGSGGGPAALRPAVVTIKAFRAARRRRPLALATGYLTTVPLPPSPPADSV